MNKIKCMRKLIDLPKWEDYDDFIPGFRLFYIFIYILYICIYIHVHIYIYLYIYTLTHIDLPLAEYRKCPYSLWRNESVSYSLKDENISKWGFWSQRVWIWGPPHWLHEHRQVFFLWCLHAFARQVRIIQVYFRGNVWIVYIQVGVSLLLLFVRMYVYVGRGQGWPFWGNGFSVGR